MTDTADRTELTAASLPTGEGAATPGDREDRGDAGPAPRRRSGSLSAMLLPELQQLAGSLGISTARKKKSDLVSAIEAHRAGNGPTAGAAAAARRAWRRTIGRPYLLTVGGIEPRKGSLDLLEAYARLRSSHPELGLVIAGGETLFDYRDYRAHFDMRAAELGITPAFLGPVADDRLRMIFICCHPALALEARIALTLRMLGGLSAAEIARAGA